jgi:hypothetical protein
MVMVDLGIPPGSDLLTERSRRLPEQERWTQERSSGEVQSDGHTPLSISIPSARERQLPCTIASALSIRSALERSSRESTNITSLR